MSDGKIWKTGMLWPVWWDTDDGKEQHEAIIYAIKKYDGLYKDWFTHIFKLQCPPNRSGYAEMTVKVENAECSKD